MICIEKRILLVEPMLQLSEEDTNEFREIFGLVDTDGSGKISPQELGELTRKLGLNYTEVHSLGMIDHQYIEMFLVIFAISIVDFCCLSLSKPFKKET